MSKHFTEKLQLECKTGLAYFFSPRRPLTEAEKRYVQHARFRVAAVFMMCLYFVYCNPEYSYTYEWIRKQYGWDKCEPLFPQYLKLAHRSNSGQLDSGKELE